MPPAAVMESVKRKQHIGLPFLASLLSAVTSWPRFSDGADVEFVVPNTNKPPDLLASLVVALADVAPALNVKPPAAGVD